MVVKYVCEFCGSDDVLVDAWGCWDIGKQEWVLAETFQETYCLRCDGDCDINEVKISDAVN